MYYFLPRHQIRLRFDCIRLCFGLFRRSIAFVCLVFYRTPYRVQIQADRACALGQRKKAMDEQITSTGTFTIRNEVPSDDAAAIRSVTEQAFAGKPYADGTEPLITDRLRSSGRLTISVVAVAENNKVIGHAAASPVIIGDDAVGGDAWYGIGPVSVLPTYQRQGVGSALMRELLAQLQSLCAAGCVLLGNPHFYSRFGFVVRPEITYPGPDSKFFQTLAWVEELPKGVAKFDEAFG